MEDNLRALALLFALLCACSFLVPAGGQRRCAVQTEAEPLQAVRTSEKKVALTFDADTDAQQIASILGTLRRCHVRATFFVTGVWVQKYPEEVKKIVQQGNEIASHGDTHRDMAEMTPQQQREDLLVCSGKIKAACGIEPHWFRPPYRKWNDSLLRTAHSLGLRVADCSVQTDEWRNVSPQVICRQAVSGVTPGGILLLRCVGLNVAAALPRILQTLQNQGWQIDTLTQLTSN
jgi:peptidoglycan/xylan/chitin deacetylase (PgdA/CDA1 family)